MLLLALACTPPPDPCTGRTQQLYDPDGPELTAWPDDAFTVADGTSTGRRVDVSGAPFAVATEGLLGSLPPQLDGASGFGTLGEIVLRFTAPVDPPPPDSVTSLADAGLQLLDLSTSPPTRVAYRGHALDSGRQLMLQPLRPLKQGAPHAVVMTTAYRSDGQCVAQAPRVTQDLEAGVHDDLLEALDLHDTEVSAVLRFTTHDDQQAVIAAAEEARTAPQSWVAPLECEALSGHRRCESAFEPLDFRGPDGRVGRASVGRHTVPVSLWIPDGVAEPVVVVVGHGLGSDRHGAQGMADRLLPLGVAVVAVDALEHGDHPTASLEGGATALPFLGIDLGTATFSGRRMRSNFDQSVLERVQLLTLLRTVPDLDGDGTADVGTERFGYVGISLGGLMGAGLLALTDLELGALPIAGGDLASITRDTEVMAGVLPLLADLAGSDAALERWLSVTQSIVDPADPALWASHVLEDRLYGAQVPHVLLPVAQHDEVVPPAAGRALARALRLPHVEPIQEPVDGLPLAGPAPIVANHESGATVGFFQYETVTVGGQTELAIHDNLPWSEEGTAQVVHFVESWLAGQPEILVP
ncbi:MAG: hypothetical protein R3F61_36555 [Myxococcota bacterium]